MSSSMRNPVQPGKLVPYNPQLTLKEPRTRIEVQDQDETTLELQALLDKLGDVPAPTPDQIQKLMTVQALMLRDIGWCLTERALNGKRNDKELRFGLEFMRESRMTLTEVAKLSDKGSGSKDDLKSDSE